MANCDVGAHNLDANKAYYYLGSGRRFCKRLNYAGSLKRNFENCLEAMYFRQKKNFCRIIQDVEILKKISEGNVFS